MSKPGPVLPLADVALHWLLLIFGVGGLIFLVVVGRLYGGSGADLLDHPSRDAHQRLADEREDLRGLLAAENNRRRAAGEPELSEEEIERDGLKALRRTGDGPRA